MAFASLGGSQKTPLAAVEVSGVTLPEGNLASVHDVGGQIDGKAIRHPRHSGMVCTFPSLRMYRLSGGFSYPTLCSLSNRNQFACDSL